MGVFAVSSYVVGGGGGGSVMGAGAPTHAADSAHDRSFSVAHSQEIALPGKTYV